MFPNVAYTPRVNASKERYGFLESEDSFVLKGAIETAEQPNIIKWVSESVEVFV